MWGFETDEQFQEQLDWIGDFVTREVEPIDLVIPSPYDVADPVRNRLIRPLQQIVRSRGLWACHLGAELGGAGYGQLKLALMNEILGRTRSAPSVFGCQAPDSGNSEILARYGTPAQKAEFLEPLLKNEIVSCFSMTEPQGGADPSVFTTRAEPDGDDWIINGEKWFSSNARHASFLIVMAISDPDNPPHQSMSMYLVPTNTPGVTIVRNVAHGMEDPEHGSHAYIRFEDVHIPTENMLGPRGGAFVVAQTRLGGGRIHHSMRTIGLCRKTFDMMCERAVSRTTQGALLGTKQMIQEKIADSWAEIEMFRLLVLQTAWKIDKFNDYKRVRKDIAAVKATMPKVLHDVASRALQIHGSIGVTNEMPFQRYVLESFHMGLADGPTEVHKVTVAREVLREYRPVEDLFPSQHIPRLRAAAELKFAEVLTEADI